MEGIAMIKPFFTGLLIGILMALLAVFYWPKRAVEAPIIAEKFQAERHSEEIQAPTHGVRAQGKKAVFTYEVPTERYGLLKGEVQASRAALQYRHRLELGAAFVGGAVLARGAYAYKNIELAAYGGWDIKYSRSIYGAGLSWCWSF